MQAHKAALNKYLVTRPEDVILWTNEVGQAYTAIEKYKTAEGILLKRPRVIRYGVGGVGFPDLVGFTKTVITPEMVGQTLPVFTTVEMKQGADRLRKEQKQWHSILTGHGCWSSVVYYDGKVFQEVEV